MPTTEWNIESGGEDGAANLSAEGFAAAAAASATEAEGYANDAAASAVEAEGYSDASAAFAAQAAAAAAERSGVSLDRYEFSATVGQTVFTGTDANGAILETSAMTAVYMNGSLLAETADYTKTASTITLVDAAEEDDEVVALVFRQVSSSDGATTFTTIAALAAYANQDPTPIVAGREYRAAGYSFTGLGAPAAFFPAMPYVRPGRDFAYFSQWGAVGDGTADDADALNAALTGYAYLKGEPGQIFRCGEKVVCPSNRRVDLNGARLRRGAYGTVMEWLFETVNARTTWDASDIQLENWWIDDNGVAGNRGNGNLLIGDRITVNGYGGTFSAPYDATVGAWMTYAAGDDITFGGVIDIDTRLAGQWSDCFHVGAVRRLLIGAHRLRAGDDGIALYAAPRTYPWRGRNHASDGVVIMPGYTSSVMANALRIGGQTDLGGVEAASVSDVVWKNVTVVNEVVGPCDTIVALDDRRTTSEIGSGLKSDNINITLSLDDQSAALRFLYMTGNPDVTNAANRAQHNFGRVTVDLRGRQRTSTGGVPGQLIFGGGVDRLEFSGDLITDLPAASGTTHCTVHQIDDLVLNGVEARSDTTAAFFALNYVRRLWMNGCDFSQDANAEFQTVNIALNTNQDFSAYVEGGRINDTARTFVFSGTGAVKDFHLVKAQLLGSATTIPNFSAVTSWTSGGTVILDPAAMPVLTVSALPGSGVPITTGTQAFVTDANATTRGAVVAGGGSNRVMVYRDNTDWRIL